MSKDASDVFEHHPTNSDLDLVNTSKGPMSRKDYQEWRSANPKPVKTGPTEYARQMRQGEITNTEYNALMHNHFSDDTEQKVHVPTGIAARQYEAERDAYGEYNEAEQNIYRIAEAAVSRAKQGLPVNRDIVHRLDDALMQTMTTASRLGLEGVEDDFARLQSDVNEAKEAIMMAKAMSKLGR